MHAPLHTITEVAQYGARLSANMDNAIGTQAETGGRPHYGRAPPARQCGHGRVYASHTSEILRMRLKQKIHLLNYL